MTDKPVSYLTADIYESMIAVRDRRIEALEKLLSTIAADAFAILGQEAPSREPVVYENAILNRKLNWVFFEARTANALQMAGLERLGDLVKKTRNEVLAIPNLGVKSVNEIEITLEGADLTLAGGMSRQGSEALKVRIAEREAWAKRVRPASESWQPLI